MIPFDSAPMTSYLRSIVIMVTIELVMFLRHSVILVQICNFLLPFHYLTSHDEEPRQNFLTIFSADKLE